MCARVCVHTRTRTRTRARGLAIQDVNWHDII
jgi:hypothetical protein